jgi:hypothetical protein
VAGADGSYGDPLRAASGDALARPALSGTASVQVAQEQGVPAKLAEAAAEVQQTRRSIADLQANLRLLASTVQDLTTSVLSSSGDLAHLKLGLS